MIVTLTPAMRAMLIASEPDDRTGEEGCGVELRTGGDYATAKALERRELGHREGPGGPLSGMYWSNADGLAERAALLASDRAPDAGDICACGHMRGEHVDGGRCVQRHEPSPCSSFRLSCTAEEMNDAWDEWSKDCEARGV
jgi:hypothetical protein